MRNRNITCGLTRNRLPPIDVRESAIINVVFISLLLCDCLKWFCVASCALPVGAFDVILDAVELLYGAAPPYIP